MASARVRSEHFDEVVLFDRDDIPNDTSVRNGVPQANHFHGILPGGLEIMENFFPGFTKELDRCGSVVPEPSEFYVFTPEGKSYDLMSFQAEPLKLLPGFPRVHIQTRGLLEHCLRQRVEAIENVQTRYTTLIKDIVHDHHAVTGVRVGDEIVACDLVIDATGRVSRTLGWLDQMGYQRPDESTIQCDFAYTTVFSNRIILLYLPTPDFLSGRERRDPTKGGVAG